MKKGKNIMELMSTKMYIALKKAGVPTQDAEDAASDLGQLEVNVIELKNKHLLTHWMIGFNLVLTLAILGKLLVL